MSDVIECEKLRLHIEKIERLEEEKRGVMDDVKDVYAMAKSDGYDPKAMRAVIKLRKMERHQREEAEMILDTYKAALGI